AVVVLAALCVCLTVGLGVTLFLLMTRPEFPSNPDPNPVLPKDPITTQAKDGEHAKDKIEAPPVVLTEKQKAAAADAIKALGRIEAAVQVGVNFQQYGQLVIDAKAAVNEAKRTLPAGKLLASLSMCMVAYQDANTVWDLKVNFQRGPNKEL